MDEINAISEESSDPLMAEIFYQSTKQEGEPCQKNQESILEEKILEHSLTTATDRSPVNICDSEEVASLVDSTNQEGNHGEKKEKSIFEENSKEYSFTSTTDQNSPKISNGEKAGVLDEKCDIDQSANEENPNQDGELNKNKQESMFDENLSETSFSTTPDQSVEKHDVTLLFSAKDRPQNIKQGVALSQELESHSQIYPDSAFVITIDNDQDSVTSENEFSADATKDSNPSEFIVEGEERLNSEEQSSGLQLNDEIFENTDLSEDEISSRAAKTNSAALPYFEGGNTNLEIFLTGARQSISETRTSLPRPRIMEPKEKDRIVFEIEVSNSSANRSSKNVSKKSPGKNLAQLVEDNDDKSPGVKRLFLRNFLRHKIEEKKVNAFKKSKEIAVEENTNVIDNSESDSEEDTEFATNPEVVSEDDDDIGRRKTIATIDDFSDDSSSPFENEDDNIDCKTKTVKPPDSLETPVRIEMSCSRERDEDEINNIRDSDEDLPAFSDFGLKNSNVQSISPRTVMAAESQENSPQKYSPRNNSCTPNDVNENSVPNTLDVTFDDLPMDKESGAFVTQDLLSICSGSFKNQSDEQETLENSLKRNLDSDNDADLSDFEYKPEADASNDSSPIDNEEPPSPVIQAHMDPDHEEVRDFRIHNGSDDKIKRSPWNCIQEKNEEEDEERMKAYFDFEAELSGEDDGLDDDPEKETEVENLINDDELPPEVENPEEILHLHRKKVQDEDDELVEYIKERYLPEGELHTEGQGRIRQFAWYNTDLPDVSKDDKDTSSDSDEEESFTPVSKEKAKLDSENNDDFHEVVPHSCKDAQVKIKIIGKPETKVFDADSKLQASKRKRGSFLMVDNKSDVIKKLKLDESTDSGSRTTRHFVFRQDNQDSTQN